MSHHPLMIPEVIKQALPKGDAFEQLMRLSGKVFRDVKGRKTMQVEIAGISYFIKQHFGVGWGEIVKSFLSLKKPVLGAMTEVEAIKRLTDIGIPTTPLVAFGAKGKNPAKQRSFIITADLGYIISLEELCADWKINPPESNFKQSIIIEMARLSAKLHQAGLCHRDFYLCHFVIKKTDLAQGVVSLILIDLHRVLFNQPSHGDSVMKDIAGLMFSAIDCGFTEEDWVLFKQNYLPQSEKFWAKVEARANQLYKKFHSDKFQQRLTKEKSALH